uniref:Uncharacterized protein n=1 Tax=Meloidogyne enterolobii TaxID=390850 RepID=A0A6V7XIU4_MELEN|nr:unnamed protein product [Meloidogyne enterolobii]
MDELGSDIFCLGGGGSFGGLLGGILENWGVYWEIWGVGGNWGVYLGGGSLIGGILGVTPLLGNNWGVIWGV